MMSSVQGIPSEDVKIGMRVAARFERVSEADNAGQAVRVVFAPVDL
jgi:hypothetical protein